MRCHCGVISRVYVPLAISDANLILSTYGQCSRCFPGRTSSRGKTGSTKTSRGCSKPMAFKTSTSYPRPLCFLPSTRNSAVSGHPSVQSESVWLLTKTTSIRKMCLLLCWTLITLSLCPHANLRLLQQRQGRVDHQTCCILQGQRHLPCQQCKCLRKRWQLVGAWGKNTTKTNKNAPQFQDNGANNGLHN